MNDLLAIIWRHPEARGFTDLIPLDWFEKKGSSSLMHWVNGPTKEDCGPAKCIVEVNDRNATLNYEHRRVRNFNLPDWHLGVLRIHFSGNDRRNVTAIEWRDEGETLFTSGYIRWESRPTVTDVDLLESGHKLL